MENSIEQAFADLLQWCQLRDFAGHDPFDALNSRVLQITPLTHSRTARLIATQLIKRSPWNLRPLARVPGQKNSKGIALFALAALSRYRLLKTPAAEKEARELLDELLRMQIAGYSGAAWGYNFDWQSRNFFAPRGTPMMVPTAFAARALIDAYETFKDAKYLETARSSCEFVLKDLRRTVESNRHEADLCVSDSAYDGAKIFNARLFAAETLAGVAARARKREFRDVAN